MKALPAVLSLLKGNTMGIPQVNAPGGGGGIDMAPTSVMSEEVAKANAEGVQSSDMKQRYPLTPTEAGKFGTGELLDPTGFDPAPAETGGKGMFGDMSTSEKLAMAASLGSLLRGPGAPPPPGARSGGQGINMTPQFQNVTLRQLGRR
jgi:hypothetical protein